MLTFDGEQNSEADPGMEIRINEMERMMEKQRDLIMEQQRMIREQEEFIRKQNGFTSDFTEDINDDDQEMDG